MKRSIRLIVFCHLALLIAGFSWNDEKQNIPVSSDVMEAMTLANDYFMAKNPDTGADLIQPPSRRIWSSNIWTRATYFTGLIEMYEISHDQRLLDYVIDWGESHKWGLADKEMWNDHAAGQVYIDVYLMDTSKHEYTTEIKESIDRFIETGDTMGRGFGADWNWIDAAYMAMPVFAKLGRLTGNRVYFDKMYELYSDMKDSIQGGLFNENDGLWWRDGSFTPPYSTPNNKHCYWSRGNGWVIAGLVRTLKVIPSKAPHRVDYKDDYLQMCKALLNVQREDGMWNVSLFDPDHFGGKELTGSAFFLYAMAWGVNNGLLDDREYIPAIFKGWNAMVRDCMHPDGFLGYVQGTGKEPKDHQPVTYESAPDFEDFGLGAFLLAGSEVYKLAEDYHAGKHNIIDYPYQYKVDGNPIVRHIRTADPDVHVWDGKLWMYTSQDINNEYCDMDGYHVFSTEDLLNWTDHGEILHSRDLNWGVGSGFMWAPGAAGKNGIYYLYFPHRDSNNEWRIGVATSDKPEGPFVPEDSYIEGTFNIDPRCFVDDDSKAYLYFGRGYVARLSEDMLSLAEKPRLLDYGTTNFREGAYMHKRNGVYYLSWTNYLHEKYEGMYAMGDNPYGPFEFKGPVHKKPIIAQDHHSIIEFKDEWYYFYHIGTYIDEKGQAIGTRHSRSVCLDKLYYNEDGTMQIIKETLAPGIIRPAKK